MSKVKEGLMKAIMRHLQELYNQELLEVIKIFKKT